MRGMSDLLSPYGRTRRSLLLTGAAAMTAWAGRAPALAIRDVTGPDPFTLGVASGDPWADSVVLWTRLAPQPLALDGARRHAGARGDRPVGTGGRRPASPASCARARSSPARPTPMPCTSRSRGLAPGREYHYRFEAMGHRSRTGRTRTAPARGQLAPATLRGGLLFALRDRLLHGLRAPRVRAPRPRAAPRRLHLRVRRATRRRRWRARSIRARSSRSPTTVAGTRSTGSIPTCRRCTRRRPSPSSGTTTRSTTTGPATSPRTRRRVSSSLRVARRPSRRYHEVMPMRRAAAPSGPAARIYRELAWGDLANLYMLDTRQFRDDQPCGDGNRVDCAERLVPSRTMLGGDPGAVAARPRRGLARALGRARPAGLLRRSAASTARRPGCPADGQLERLRRRARSRDRHVLGPAAQLRRAHRRRASPLRGDAARGRRRARPSADRRRVRHHLDHQFRGRQRRSGRRSTRSCARNPHLRFMCDRRGYLLAEVTPQSWTTHYRVVPFVTRPGAPLETRRVARHGGGRARDCRTVG